MGVMSSYRHGNIGDMILFSLAMKEMLFTHPPITVLLLVGHIIFALYK